MKEALVDFYRCPEGLINFSLVGQLSPELGYFAFGDGTVCYGPTSWGSPAKVARNGLRDVSQHVIADGPHLGLPFNPSQIVENLRRERYTADGYEGKRPILSSRAMQKTYYCLRPLLPVSVRKHLQRLFLRNWDRLFFPRWPVDTTVEQILERLLVLILSSQKLERIPFIWFWPEGALSCAVVTHDVETQGGLGFASRLMDLDEAFGIKSSFQIVPEGQYPVSDNFLNTIRTRGFEVGIQDLNHDGNLFDDHEEFLLQAQSINAYLQKYGAQGFRSGRLYRNADWYEALDISYDMSIPNVAHLEPQRGGCCTVFPYFVGRVLEIPLTTIQDYSLFHILGEYSVDLWKRQIALIMEKNGLVSFIVHPDYITEKRALEAYKALLRHLSDLRSEGKVWTALPREVNRWWRERSQTKVVLHDGAWRIEGPAQERARIAYASMKDGHLIYRMAPAPFTGSVLGDHTSLDSPEMQATISLGFCQK